MRSRRLPRFSPERAGGRSRTLNPSSRGVRVAFRSVVEPNSHEEMSARPSHRSSYWVPPASQGIRTVHDRQDHQRLFEQPAAMS